MLDKQTYNTAKSAGKKVECASCGLAQLCIPHGLTVEELDSLDTIVKVKRRLERDEILFHAGEEITPIFAVSSGSMKTSITNEEGSEQITGFYLPGEIVGLDGLGGLAPNSTATALETSTVCEIPGPEFDKLCANNHGLRTSFMQVVSKEISREQQMMMTLGQLSADARLASFMLTTGDRFLERGFSATEYNLSMSRHDLANYLGLAVETLSRLFKKFQENGLVEVHRRHIKIIDWDAMCIAAHAECGKKKVDKQSNLG